ncbi:MAG: thioredoxin [Candidatus Pacebacteria bacterium]|nr:thioredoxin [Candidatus Paceibacterota bacterium]PIR60124.1 MAG: thioredoxin [Candidatus Pacebacteria bacterium CG10_big_fil_rev_8_21_14_0_10_44_54]
MSEDKKGAAHLNQEEFTKILADAGDQPVMIDFYAEWCGPCKMAAPIIDELATEYTGTVVIAKVDVDAENKLAQDHRVMSIPTVIIFKNGEEVDRMTGFAGKEGYVGMIDKALDK